MSRSPIYLLLVGILLNWNCSSTSTSIQSRSSSQTNATAQTIFNPQAVQGGMWIPNEVNAQDMNEKGLQLQVEQLFNNQKSGLNSAIAHFGGGCTSELISPKGLLLTNHHCGYGQIQSHSTVENNYLKEGFWAYDFSEELPNEGLTATFVIDIQEVTSSVFAGINSSLSEDQKLAIQQENIEKIKKNTTLQPFQEILIKPYFDGNKYYKITTETYKDVRLVGAPSSSIGKFGSDTDNWMWPRHTGDFSIFRIYADQNNRPAEYSPNNVPYQPNKFLNVSIKGVNKDDFTMVYGFPGRTQEYLPAIAVQNITQVKNPAAIAVRKIALNILDEKMRKDEATRIKYASKYASISNYYKKWIGENLGIEKTGAIQKKERYEEVFTRNLNEDQKLNNQYGLVLPQLLSLHQQQKQFLQPEALYSEIFLRNSDSFIFAYLANRILQSEGSSNYEKTKNWAKGILERRYKNYDPILDLEVSAALANYYVEALPSGYLESSITSQIKDIPNYFGKSVLTDGKMLNGVLISENIDKAFENDEVLLKALKNDRLVQWVKEVTDNYSTKTNVPNEQLQNEIDALQKEYMAAQMKVFEDAKFYPDANSTLRITYGKVDSYSNSEGVTYPYQTYLKGVMEKYKPGDYEFDVSQKLQDLYQSKDYGVYGENGKMPVNFIASNHTTGGNSGSPALDGEGNLIGLNFDRVWEGTMSDLNYDPSICRNIMVDTRYIMFIIDKYANAQNLIQEIQLVK